jgi:hypothetical protein
VGDPLTRHRAARQGTREPGTRDGGVPIDPIEEREFSDEERKDLAKQHLAREDGSYPIRNVADLKNAIQAFGRASPGDRAAVKAWIKKRAKALGAEDDLPEDWKESAPIVETAPASWCEEAEGGTGREWDVLLIQVGESANHNYYSAETLKAAVPLFEGVSAFADHVPEGRGRSIRDKVGRFRSPEFGRFTVGDRSVEGIRARLRVIDPQMRTQMLEAHRAGEPDFVGFSINAEGHRRSRDIDGRKVNHVDRLTRVRSVDAVAEPSAGGQPVRLVAGGIPHEDRIEMTPEEIQAAIARALTEALPGAVTPLLAPIQAQITTLTEARETPQPPPPPEPPAPPPPPPVDVTAQLEALREDLRKTNERAAAFANLEEAIAAATGLSELGKARVRKDYQALWERRAWAPEELAARIKEEVDHEGALLQQFNRPVAIGQRGPRASMGDGPTEKFTKQLAGFFQNEPVDGIPAFRTLQEAYARWTGQDYLDVNHLEMFAAFGGKYDSSFTHARLQESLTTAAWGDVFADQLYVQMLRAYRTSPMYDQWRQLCSYVENVPDFQTRHWVRIGGYADLGTVAEQATYPQLTSPADEAISYAIAKRGGLDDVTLEMLSYERGAQKIRQIPVAMARSAARTLFKFVLNMVTTDNPTLDYDSVALYHSNHANTGTTALSVAGLNTTQIAMRNQTAYNESAEILGMRNAIKTLVVPNTLEMRARRVVGDFPNNNYNYALSSTPDADTALDPTSFYGRGISVLVYDQLTDATDWWAIANPAEMNAVVIGFWNGATEPEMFVQDNALVGAVFSADKISYKIRHVYGGDVADHRSFYRQVVAG